MGIDREWCRLLDCEDEGYAGAERRWDKRDSNQRLYQVEAGHRDWSAGSEMKWVMGMNESAETKERLVKERLRGKW